MEKVLEMNAQQTDRRLQVAQEVRPQEEPYAAARLEKHQRRMWVARDGHIGDCAPLSGVSPDSQAIPELRAFCAPFLDKGSPVLPRVPCYNVLGDALLCRAPA